MRKKYYWSIGLNQDLYNKIWMLSAKETIRQKRKISLAELANQIVNEYFEKLEK